MLAPSLVCDYGRKSLRRTVNPATKVISVADLKTYLKIDGTDEDTILGYLIDAATDLAEIYCRRAFISQTFKMTMDNFGGGSYDDSFLEGVHNLPRGGINSQSVIELMRPPIISITSITTYDEANNSSVFSSSNYTLDGNGGRIYLNESVTWPTGLRDRAAIEIVYVAGYGATTADVPSSIKTAVMVQAAAMYECRGQADLVAAAKGLLDPFRLLDDLMA